MEWSKAGALVVKLKKQLAEAEDAERELRRKASIALLPEATGNTLSRRQQEVYELVLKQKTNKEIAWELNISERTVKFHVSDLLSKFCVRSRVDLVLGKLLKPCP